MDIKIPSPLISMRECTRSKYVNVMTFNVVVLIIVKLSLIGCLFLLSLTITPNIKPFSKVYGTEPTEEYLPSNVNNAKKVNDLQQGIATSKLTAQNVRLIMKCTSCQKPCCIYVIRALSQREMIELKQVLEKSPYVCGCLIAPDSSFIDGHVFMRLAMHCNTPIEWA